MENLRASDGFDGDDDAPEVPIEPADGKASPVTKACARKFRERADALHGHGHLAEHAHDQQDKQAGDGIADDYGRACRFDSRTATHEETGTDDATDGNHEHVPRL